MEAIELESSGSFLGSPDLIERDNGLDEGNEQRKQIDFRLGFCYVLILGCIAIFLLAIMRLALH